MTRMPATPVAGIFVMGFVRGESRDQGSLFPLSLDQLVPEERRLLEAWFSGKPVSFEHEALLAERGFDRDSGAGYTRLDDPFYRGGDVVGVLMLRGKLPDSSAEPRVIDAMN